MEINNKLIKVKIKMKKKYLKKALSMYYQKMSYLCMKSFQIYLKYAHNNKKIEKYQI